MENWKSIDERLAPDEFAPTPVQIVPREDAKAGSSAAIPADIGTLTAHMARNDEAAYREFYGRYFNRLLRYLLVVTGGREEAARDALQLTLVRVLRNVRRFNAEDAFWSWLTVLARSSVVDEQRKRNRYRALLERFFDLSRSNGPGDGGEADDRLETALANALAGLSDEDRQLLERKYFAGEAVKEIAAQTGSSEKAIESRLVRVRRELKAALVAELKNED